jgi:hypothetical protein
MFLILLRTMASLSLVRAPVALNSSKLLLGAGTFLSAACEARLPVLGRKPDCHSRRELRPLPVRFC